MARIVGLAQTKYFGYRQKQEIQRYLPDSIFLRMEAKGSFKMMQPFIVVTRSFESRSGPANSLKRVAFCLSIALGEQFLEIS